MSYAIQVEQLSKQYELGLLQSGQLLFREWLEERIRNPLRLLRRPPHQPFWALKDVSFDVAVGEAVGIIGHNGAGKSTLLKILSRITEPTSGRARLAGRVASMLEVGTGFHPELTGRENIFLNGAILGMPRREIAAKFDAIVAFAEVEAFIDTPIKRYSSGMQMRLAFAVAAHLEPDILVVDEVLAVGDAAFQKKCLGQMDEASQQGRTILFVSHNAAAIRSLTKKCLYLDHGRVVDFGATGPVLNRYLLDCQETPKPLTPYSVDFYRRDLTKGDIMRVERVWTTAPESPPLEIPLGQDFSVFVEYSCFQAVARANLTLVIKNRLGHRAAVLFSWDHGFELNCQPGRHLVRVDVQGLPLAPGPYTVDVGLNQSFDTLAYDVILDYPLVQVTNPGVIENWVDRPWGAVHWQQATWQAWEKEDH